MMNDQATTISGKTPLGEPLTHDFVGRLLRFPLFYKVLIANSLLIILGAFVGTAITLRVGLVDGIRGSWVAIVFSVIGVILTITLNSVILQAALQPVRMLRFTASALENGNFSARVPPSPLADADLANVAITLNDMLDRLQRYQERVQDLSAGVLRAQEEERQRIARELHDQIGQSLTLLLVRLKILEASPNVQTALVSQDIAELRAAVAATIDQVRKLALDLRPPALDQLGLVPAVRALVRDFNEQTRIQVLFDAPESEIDLPMERATALYRIVQEALTNIAKHAEAHQVHIVFTAPAGMIRVTVSDDGHGFDLAEVRRLRTEQPGQGVPGLGLFGMEERARLLGGSLHIESRPGSGTILNAAIPINPLEHPHGTSDFYPIANSARNANHPYPAC